MKGVRMRSFREWQTERAQHFAVKHVLSTSPDLSKINWAFINFPSFWKNILH